MPIRLQLGLTLALIALSPVTASYAEAGDRAKDRAELTKLKEQRWNRFYRERDVEGLDAFLHDDFVLLTSDGAIEGKAQALDYVRTTDWPLAERDFRYEVLDIQFTGPDSANVFGRGTFDGATCRQYYVSSNILVREAGEWRPIFSHTSPSACLEGE